jgi:hypothetical protein
MFGCLAENTILSSRTWSDWFVTKICHRFGKPKLNKKNYHGFSKPNVRDWQVLIANQTIAKIMAC